MSRRALQVLVVLGTACGMLVADQSPFVVQGPTIFAFFGFTQKEVDNGLVEVLDDFQHYAAEAHEPLRKSGITFRQVYAPSFRVQVGTSVSTFHPGKTQVGYYFIAPGKKPRIEYGVMTHIDLFQIARDYFRITVK